MKQIDTELTQEAKVVEEYLNTPNIQRSLKLPVYSEEMVSPLMTNLTKAKQNLAKLEEKNMIKR